MNENANNSVPVMAAPVAVVALAAIRCPRCGGLVDAPDRFCRHCGCSMGVGSWYHSLWFVLLMLFVVVGPFALPLLWRSPRFSRAAKYLWTTLSLLHTLLMCYAARETFLRLRAIFETALSQYQ